MKPERFLGQNIIESGSLLGVNYKNVKSYPVGYENRIAMYPMTFREFCIANGMPADIMKLLEDAYKKAEAVSEVIHRRMMDLFQAYMVVGGMPAAVQEFVNTRDISKVVRIQKDILELYRQDISKYADEKEKTKVIFDLIPSELNEKIVVFSFLP